MIKLLNMKRLDNRICFSLCLTILNVIKIYN